MKEYITYLAVVTQERMEIQLIIKVDQTNKINRPNNIDDEEWIEQMVEYNYGYYEGIEIITLNNVGYDCLNFEDFNGEEN